MHTHTFLRIQHRHGSTALLPLFVQTEIKREQHVSSYYSALRLSKNTQAAPWQLTTHSQLCNAAKPPKRPLFNVTRWHCVMQAKHRDMICRDSHVEIKILHSWRSLLHWRWGQSLSRIGSAMVSSLLSCCRVRSQRAAVLRSFIFGFTQDLKRFTRLTNASPQLMRPIYSYEWKLMPISRFGWWVVMGSASLGWKTLCATRTVTMVNWARWSVL